MKLLLLIGMGLAGVLSFIPPALADMGPAITVAVLGAAGWHLFLGLATIAPRWMSGRRANALAIYSGAVIASWIINLAMPVDSLKDFAVVGLLPLVTSICLIAYRFIRRIPGERVRL
jgi:hypothetical protein